MELKLIRYDGRKNSSGGLFYVDDKFHGYTCEDEKRDVKVAGETRIPEGRYRVLLRNEGGMTKRYAKKFPGLHRGMLHIQDVPNFTYCYIHIGNTERHTDGCPLIGYGSRLVDNDIQVTNSTAAYEALYVKVLAAMDAGEEVWVEIKEIKL